MQHTSCSGFADRLCFVLPDDSAQVSGGNVYNRELVRALRKTRPIRTCSVRQLTALFESAEPGLYVMDTLNLRDALELPRAHPGQHLALLVHHLPSLEPDSEDHEESCLESRALACFDTWIATSDFTARVLVDRGCARSRILTVPPGLSEGPWISRAPPETFTALLVGNCIPRKGALELLSALSERLPEGPRFRLEIVGRIDQDVEYVQACRALLHESARLRDSVQFAGPVPYERMGACYERASVLVSASKMETFGMALLEARAHGLPILAVDAGNAREHVVSGDNGRLFASIDALADALLALLLEPAEARNWFERAQRGRQQVGYTWQGAAERFLSEISGR